MGPNYPLFPSQPNSGNLPGLKEVGPPDTLYSTGPAPYYERKIDMAHGRYLAGTDVEVQDEGTKPSMAQNELEYYRAMDDVQGDGIFDPPGTSPNIHPDAGVFAARFSLPGYHARERPFSMSEVRDVTTGRPIRAVPSGAVAFDSAAQISFIEQGMYQPAKPLYSAANLGPLRSQSIANVMQNPQPIGVGAFAMPEFTWKTALVAVGIGAALGAAIGAMSRKKRA